MVLYLLYWRLWTTTAVFFYFKFSHQHTIKNLTGLLTVFVANSMKFKSLDQGMSMLRWVGTGSKAFNDLQWIDSLIWQLHSTQQWKLLAIKSIQMITKECLEFEKAETSSPKSQCKLFYGSQDSLSMLARPHSNMLKRDGDVVPLNAEKWKMFIAYQRSHCWDLSANLNPCVKHG